MKKRIVHVSSSMMSGHEVLSLFPVHHPPAPPVDLVVRGTQRSAVEAVAAIEQGKANAHKRWLDEAGRVVRDLAGTRGQAGFITDEVMNHLEECGYVTHDTRALGGVVEGLRRQGVIRRSGRQERSARRRSMVPVWVAGDLDRAGHHALNNTGEAA